VDIVFLSPVVPKLEGHGASMRAGLNLEALSEIYNVHLVILHIGACELDVPEKIELLCASILKIPLPKLPEVDQGSLHALVLSYIKKRPSLIREYPAHLALEIDAKLPPIIDVKYIHCFRLALSDVALRLSKILRLPKVSIIVDLDDYESATLHRRTALKKREIGRVRYLLERFEVLRLSAAERRLAKEVGQLFLCSKSDRDRFTKAYSGSRVVVLPNGYRFEDRLPPVLECNKHTIAFIGTLGYEPNVDALEYFIGDVWPLVLQRSSDKIKLLVAGRSPSELVKRLCNTPRVTLISDTPDIRQIYLNSAVIIVPLRMGGGTRIKIIEALGFGRPVVSTTIGAEGLEIDDNKHLLIADSADAFASACVNLIMRPNVAERLVSAGQKRVKTLYSPEIIKGILTKSYDKCE
jgi:glycosyltransferase involved in cell wall biosynthesis